MKTLPIAISVYREGDNPVYGESCTHIELHDEAGGGFVSITQLNEGLRVGEIKADIEELAHIYKKAKEMIDSYEKELAKEKTNETN